MTSTTKWLLYRRSKYRSFAVALVLLFLLPLAQAGAGNVVEAVFHCCCGDHGVDGDCDCVDCPANLDADELEQEPTTSFRRCGGETKYSVSGTVFDSFVLPASLPLTFAHAPPVTASVVQLEPGPGIDPPERPPRQVTPV